MNIETDREMLNTIRRWLSEGATISATDISKPVLQLMDDGTFDGNLTIVGAGAVVSIPDEMAG